MQVTENAGANWRKPDRIPGVPANGYIARIRASQHDANTVYVAVENHQHGDFAPYLLKSSDAGFTWTSIVGDLPARGSIYAIAEDHVDPRLLFAGTEFGAYWSKDGGQHWSKIAGLPTIAVREIAIQKRENDLVLGTFGRGVYIVDDYSPLRATTAATLAEAATLYPVRDAVMFVPTLQYGMPGKGFQGEMLYTAPNPPYGAVFTYRLKDGLKTLKQKRTEAEAAAEKAGQPITYPTPEQLRAEAAEEAPAILLTISDASGTPVRVMTGPVEKGLQRVAWDLRQPAHELPPNRPRGELEELFGDPLVGPFVVPGKYSVTLSQRVGGVAEFAWQPGHVQRGAGSAGQSHAGRPRRTLAVRAETPDAQARYRRIAAAGDQHVVEARRHPAGARRHACRTAVAARAGARAQETAGGDSRGAAGRSRARIAQRADAGGDLRTRQYHQRRVEQIHSAGRRRPTISSCRLRPSSSRPSGRR